MSEPPGVFFSLCLCSESLQFTGTVRFGQVFVVKGNNSYSIRSTYFGARPKSESFFSLWRKVWSTMRIVSMSCIDKRYDEYHARSSSRGGTDTDKDSFYFAVAIGAIDNDGNGDNAEHVRIFTLSTMEPSSALASLISIPNYKLIVPCRPFSTTLISRHPKLFRIIKSI